MQKMPGEWVKKRKYLDVRMAEKLLIEIKSTCAISARSGHFC